MDIPKHIPKNVQVTINILKKYKSHAIDKSVRVHTSRKYIHLKNNSSHCVCIQSISALNIAFNLYLNSHINDMHNILRHKSTYNIKLQIRELIQVGPHGFSNFVSLRLQVHSGS